MKHETIANHEFVEFIPDKIEEGTIYISIPYATAVHKCCCGCGREVVTPISPKGWTLIFDGETISLDPSIGNWSYPCHSHYWIRRNRVLWAPKWAEEHAKPGKSHTGNEYLSSQQPGTHIANSGKSNLKGTLWQRLLKRLAMIRSDHDYDQNL